MPPINNVTGNAAAPAPPKPATPAPRPTAPAPQKPAAPAPRPAPAPQKPSTNVGVAPQSTNHNPAEHPLANLNSVKEQAAQEENAALAQVELPAWLQQTAMPAIAPGMQSGFVGFCSNQSKKYTQQLQAGCADGDIYIFKDNTYTPLKDGMRFFLLTGETFQTLMVGKEGKIKWASRDLEEQGPTEGARNYPQPHYILLLLVEVNGRLVPIKGDFRGTKSRNLDGVIRAVEAAAMPEWLTLSDKHRVTGAYPQPWGRVIHYMTTQYYVAKSSGDDTFITNVSSAPASVRDMQLLIDSFGDEEFIKELEEAKRNFIARVQFMDKKIEQPDT